jgi:hypothetical protein
LVEVEVQRGESREAGGPPRLLDVFAEAIFKSADVFGSKPCGCGFEGEPKVVQFFKIDCGEGFNVGASGLTELHEAFAFELEEGFTNGNSTDAEAVSNGRFCEEIAGGEVAEKDFAAEVGCSGFSAGERWKG